MRRSTVAFLVLLAGWAGLAHAQASDAAAIEGIRAKLVALDIEGAIAAVDALLAGHDVVEATKVSALDLRAQAHVAGGDLDAAERDYRQILALRADYAPDPGLTGKRGMERFARLAASTIGTVHVDLTPEDASILVDGRPVERGTSGSFKALAGERTLRAERKGYDASETVVRAVAGTETLVKLALVPNARDVIVQTDIPGVAVFLDGTPAGATGRPGSDDGVPAELLIRDVGMGEHEIRLEKSCFADETLQQMVRVDLADRSPERLRLATMRPARARVTVTGAAYPGELRVDGEPVGPLPLESFTMCPGRREVEVIAAGRTVWSGVVEAGEADMSLDLAPRPSCALIGGEWPKSWAAAASSWSLRGRADLPRTADLATPAGWKAVELPPGTDLALAVVPRAGIAGENRELLYSPALNVVEDLVAPPPVERPSWSAPSIDADLIDSSEGVLVARLRPDGGAARAGLQAADRVTAAGGRRVQRAADARQAIAGAKVALEITGKAGATTVQVPVAGQPHIAASTVVRESPVVRAAWGAADAAAGGPEAAAALANLATLLERAGRERVALDAWRRVRAMPGIGDAIAARADYALGAAASTDAAELLMRAKREAEAAGDVALAAAAADRLADLGIASR